MIIYTCSNPWTYWEKFWMTGPSNDLQRACTRSQAARLLVSTSIKYTALIGTYPQIVMLYLHTVHSWTAIYWKSHTVYPMAVLIWCKQEKDIIVKNYINQKIRYTLTCITERSFKSGKSINIHVAILYKNNIKKHEHVSVRYLILRCLSWCTPLGYPQTAPHQHL